MSLNDDAGRKIKEVRWPPNADNDPGDRIIADGENEILWVNSFHGDHDKDWIVQTKGGKEIARHNPRYIESIIWAD